MTPASPGNAGLAETVIRPAWPAPPHVRALATTRAGGVSSGPYASLNLGDHVGDDPAAVRRNRALLEAALGLPAAPTWLRQVHGTAIAVLDGPAGATPPTADAAATGLPGIVCAVLTADCLPVLLCNRAGTQVAAAHAGWRGLAGGVLEATIAMLAARGALPHTLLAWLGPAIGPADYEVGNEVRDAFIRTDPEALSAFRPARPGHWWLDLYTAARQRLQRAGVPQVSGGDLSTAGDAARFYSHRRDGAAGGATGRQATLVWIEPQ